MALTLTTAATNAFLSTTNTNSKVKLPITGFGNTHILPPFQTVSTPATTRLYNAEDDDAQDSEIERLKRMAAKLRSEAAALEADKAKKLAEAAENAFQKFDANSDGEVTVEELKAGLEKALKVSHRVV